MQYKYSLKPGIVIATVGAGVAGANMNLVLDQLSRKNDVVEVISGATVICSAALAAYFAKGTLHALKRDPGLLRHLVGLGMASALNAGAAVCSVLDQLSLHTKYASLSGAWLLGSAGLMAYVLRTLFRDPELKKELRD